MSASAQHTMASLEPTVVVKQELEEIVASEEVLYAASVLPPINCQIKHEEPVHIKSDVDCLPSTSQQSTLVNSAYQERSLGGEEFADSFIIYELAAAPAPSPNSAPAATTTTTTSNSQSPSPPTLLNARLRKRSKANATVAPYTLVTAKSKVPAATQVVAASAKSSAELKVKCLCRLSNHRANMSSMSVSDGRALKQFFEEMFSETRRLTHAQQRAVKLALLDAVCLAEDDMEGGKCCARFCTSQGSCQ